MSLLDLEAHVEYIEDFLTPEEARDIYQHIYKEFNIDQYRLKLRDGFSDFGKIMFIDKDLHDSNRLPDFAYGKSFIWSDKMASLKDKIESLTGHSFQVCVCIFYPDGNCGVDFHYDPPSFGDTSYIPSLSLGEERSFLLRHKNTGIVNDLILRDGSLIIMGEQCQEKYEHCLPINPSYKNGRINLTFRKFGFH